MAKKVVKTDPKVKVFIPLAEEFDTENVDQTETVIINGTTYIVKRGQNVEVPVPVFVQLRNRYPNL